MLAGREDLAPRGNKNARKHGLYICEAIAQISSLASQCDNCILILEIE
jgi:hypothetical protein